MEEKQVKTDEIIELAKGCCHVLDTKKGSDILLIDLRKINNYLDYFIIATGNSFVHCKALAIESQKYFKSHAFKERTKSRLDTGWIALDYIDIVVHIFTQEMRDFYQLEKLWADGNFLNYQGSD